MEEGRKCHGDVGEREIEEWRKKESIMGMLERETDRDREVEEGRKCHGDVGERETEEWRKKESVMGMLERERQRQRSGGRKKVSWGCWGERDRGVEEGRKCHGDVEERETEEWRKEESVMGIMRRERQRSGGRKKVSWRC